MPAIVPGCQCDVDRGPDWLLVKLHVPGVLPEESPSLAEGLWELLQRHLTYRLVLELDDVELLNSYLIGQLLRLSGMIGRHDGVLRLCGLSSSNRQVLQTSRLDARLLSYDDRHEAVMAGRSPLQPR